MLYKRKILPFQRLAYNSTVSEKHNVFDGLLAILSKANRVFIEGNYLYLVQRNKQKNIALHWQKAFFMTISRLLFVAKKHTIAETPLLASSAGNALRRKGHCCSKKLHSFQKRGEIRQLDFTSLSVQ